MANDQSAAPAPSTPVNGTTTETPATAVEAGKAVEGAVTASSNGTAYTAPTDADKTAFENGPFGDEGEYITEPTPSTTGDTDKPREPLNVVGGHP
ncbi:hypothetical protein ABTY61_18530 [Kitasatospora sp. NPDC096128]|uniref:hypothetical protein n=1 Tax=Kitasatospora sp. NPDC096128 TaxID=3155547 RepID=UPI0033264907